MKLASLFASCFLSAPALAGGWISGGTGELTGDGGNPWFLALPEQPSTITYCIDADEEAMGVKLPELTQLVVGAFSYWNAQLSTAQYSPTAGDAPGARPRVRVRSNNFEPTGKPCDDSEDVAFQFGRLSTPMQKKLVADEHVDLQHFVGFAARTAYDATLKGKGFIYIAPESGSMRPRGESLLPHFWSETSFRLLGVLRHELGHVFGVPHFGPPQGLMGQSYPETAVTTPLTSAFLLSTIAPTFRSTDGDRLKRCLTKPFPALLAKALGLDAEDRCLRFVYDGDGLLTYATESENWPWRPVARFQLTDASLRERHHEIVRIWLPESRTVLRDVPPQTRILGGPAVVETMMSGRLSRTQGGAPSLPASLMIDPVSFQLGAVVDGVMVPDLLDGFETTWQRPATR